MESCQEEKDKGLVDFLNSIKKVNEPRVHKVRGSYGVYDAYKWIRKNNWLNIGSCLLYTSPLQEVPKEEATVKSPKKTQKKVEVSDDALVNCLRNERIIAVSYTHL